MNTHPLRGATLAMACVVVLPGLACAQATAAPVAPVSAAPSPSAVPPANPAVEQRIQSLQTQLGVTQEEMPLWQAFAQAMRDNAAATDLLFQQRAAAAATMTAVENMHSYATLARTFADDTATLSTAFDSLYASLSPVQKQTADTLFRQQASATNRPRR